ncbi:hypothetical protein [Campylobacter vicugnae]|uniref:Helicase n=1 Tax=Campylobacter vicugnae TaxID=1660076 RepID=A0A1X9T3R4_9BACT|nr:MULTISPECIES: hypothetical protein [unclassified Campylobacter]ARR03066.1 hypothetical protein CVIC8964_1698 [Campylobacter sp. RM8964]
MNAVKESKKSKISLETKREIAKVGMSSSLLLTASTALFMKNKTAKTVHILSGVALVGFCLYHASLYPKGK